MEHPQKKTMQRYALWIVIVTVPALILALFLCFKGSQYPAAGEKKAADERHLVMSKESLYNNIYVYGWGPYMGMTFGYNRKIYTESIFNTKDELDLPLTYTRYMTMGLVYAKDVHSILEIGFGGGRTAWYLHKSLPNAQVTSVELDPAVMELARQYFGIRDEPNFNVVNQDGRTYLANSQDKSDVIMIDAYRGPFVPFHLLTKEFYQSVKDHLADGGVVMQNIEPSTMLFDSAVATIHSVFPNIDFFAQDGNVVTAAYDGPQKSPDELANLARERQKQLDTRYNLFLLMDQRRMFQPGMISVDAKVLTDDFAPVETLKAIENHNRKWMEK
jgi:spermidine synthase